MAPRTACPREPETHSSISEPIFGGGGGRLNALEPSFDLTWFPNVRL